MSAVINPNPEVARFIFQILREFSKSHIVIVTLVVSMMFVVPLGEMLMPFAISKLVDAIKEKNAIHAAFTWFIGAVLLTRVIYFVNDMIDIWSLPELHLFIRNDVVSRLIEAIRPTYESIDVGKFLIQVNKFPWAMNSIVSSYCKTVIPIIFIFIYLTAVAAWYDVPMAIGIVAITLFYTYFVVYRIPVGCLDISVLRDGHHNDVFSALEDTFKNLPAVYAEETIELENREMKRFNDIYVNSYKKTVICFSWTHVWMFVVSVGLVGFISWRGLQLIETKRLTLATFILIILITIQLINMMFHSDDAIREFIFNSGMIHTLLSEIPAESLYSVTDHKNKRIKNNNIIEKSEPIVSLEDVTMTNCHFKPVSATIGQRSIVLLTGPNGIGKSTLLKGIAGLTPLKSGHIENRARRIGFLPQNPALWSRTLYENLTYAHSEPKMTMEQVRDFIVDKQLDGVLPLDRLDKSVGKLGSELSGGQKQLVYALRLFLNPDIDLYLFDEPTSWLDLTIKEHFIRLMQDFKEKGTFIIVSHDVAIMSLSDEKLVLVN